MEILMLVIVLGTVLVLFKLPKKLNKKEEDRGISLAELEKVALESDSKSNRKSKKS